MKATQGMDNWVCSRVRQARQRPHHVLCRAKSQDVLLCLTESDHKEHMKAKSVSKEEALSHLHHEDYVKCLKEGISNTV